MNSESKFEAGNNERMHMDGEKLDLVELRDSDMQNKSTTHSITEGLVFDKEHKIKNGLPEMIPEPIKHSCDTATTRMDSHSVEIDQVGSQVESNSSQIEKVDSKDLSYNMSSSEKKSNSTQNIISPNDSNPVIPTNNVTSLLDSSLNAQHKQPTANYLKFTDAQHTRNANSTLSSTITNHGSNKLDIESLFNPILQTKYIETFTALGRLLSSSPLTKPPPRQLAIALSHQILHSQIPTHHSVHHYISTSMSHVVHTSSTTSNTSLLVHDAKTTSGSAGHLENSIQENDLVSWKNLKVIVTNIILIAKNQMKESNSSKRKNILWILVALCHALHTKEAHATSQEYSSSRSTVIEQETNETVEAQDRSTFEKDFSMEFGSILSFLVQYFSDRDAKVRFSAAEAAYNICNMFRGGILKFFPLLFGAICRLSGDPDPAVRNANILLTRLLKDIVAEEPNFDVVAFVDLIQERISTTNPYLRHFLLEWILLLNTVPDIQLLEYLPKFLPGIFQMCTDSNKQIVMQAHNALDQFLTDLKHVYERSSKAHPSIYTSQDDTKLTHSHDILDPAKDHFISLSLHHIDLEAILHIVLEHCVSHNIHFRLVALNWIKSLLEIDVKRALSLNNASILQAILQSIGHKEEQIRIAASNVNRMLQNITRESLDSKDVQFDNIIALIKFELSVSSMPSRVCALSWIQVLLAKDFDRVIQHIDELYVFLLNTLTDSPQEVINLVLDVLAAMASTQNNFSTLIYHLVDRLCSDKRLQSRAGSLIRQLSGMLSTEKLFREISIILRKSPFGESKRDFCSHMVQILNIILLTSQELTHVRELVRRNSTRSYKRSIDKLGESIDGSNTEVESSDESSDDLFTTLYKTWCFNPVATLSLCLLSKRYRLASLVVQTFAHCEITVSLLANIDNLVQLLESPLFVDLRLQLLEPQRHPYLIKTLYGILMLLPQGPAYNKLNQRLQAINSLFPLSQSQTFLQTQSEPNNAFKHPIEQNCSVEGEFSSESCEYHDLLEHFQSLNFSQYHYVSEDEN